MARGMAVIGSRTGGTAEIIAAGVNGLLTEPGDEHALAAAIRQLAANPARRARLAEAARRTAAQRFTLEENVRRVARHLQRAARGDTAVPTDSAITATRATTANVYSAPGGARRAVG
jgi:glycosyltransferase involved in cell wall biosynthesis